MAQLNFPDPNTTQTYTEAGITWTWNATLGVWSAEPGSADDALTEIQADSLYLSKVNDDTAAGLITFEQGVKVTGGSAAGVDDGLFAGSNFGSPILTASGGGVQLSMDKTGGGETTAHSHGIEVSFADNYIGRENGSTCYGMVLGSPKTLSTTRADQQYFGFTSNVGITSAVFKACCYFGDVSASTGVTDTAAVFYSNADKDQNPKAYNFYAARNAPSFFAGLTQHAAGVTSNGVNLFDGSSIAPPGSGSVYASDFKFGGTGYTSENLTNVRSRINVDVGTNANLYCFSASCAAQSASDVNVYGFYSLVQNSSAPNGNPYNFYAAGNAPNYFAGETIMKGGASRGGAFIKATAWNADVPRFDIFRNDPADSTQALRIGHGATTSYSIRYNGTASYTLPLSRVATTSISNAVDTIKAFTPTAEGFNAQDFIDYLPDAVDMDTLTADSVMVEKDRLIPLLTKALQEALERIEQLEADHVTMMNNNSGGSY